MIPLISTSRLNQTEKKCLSENPYTYYNNDDTITFCASFCMQKYQVTFLHMTSTFLATSDDLDGQIILTQSLFQFLSTPWLSSK